MSLSVIVETPGGPEVMIVGQVPDPSPKAGEVLIRQRAIGINFIDIYHRQGSVSLPTPFTPGVAAAGVVEALGEGVSEFQVGDRVAYATNPPGAYAQLRTIAAARVLHIPDSLGDEECAAAIFQGLTAQYLVRRTYPVKKGDIVLVHAAAGGVGGFICQWARSLGATVIGAVGGEAKRDVALQNGCAGVIDYQQEDLNKRMMELTGGRKAAVVYDSIGKDTFLKSLDCVAPLGTLVYFGASSGPAAPIDPAILAQKGSLYLTRPTIGNYFATRAELVAGSNDLFGALAKGTLQVHVRQRYPLQDVRHAHRDLETRKTTGFSVLLP